MQTDKKTDPKKFNNPENLHRGQVIKSWLAGWGNKGNPFVRYKGIKVYIEDYERKSFQLKRSISLRITKVISNCAFGKVIEHKKVRKI